MDYVHVFRGTKNIKEISEMVKNHSIHGRMKFEPNNPDELEQLLINQVGLNENATVDAKGAKSPFISCTSDINEALSFGAGMCIVITINIKDIKFYKDTTFPDIATNYFDDIIRADGKIYPIIQGQNMELLIPDGTPICGLSCIVGSSKGIEPLAIDEFIKKLKGSDLNQDSDKPASFRDRIGGEKGAARHI
ncbi:hypothetical protein [Candidatus Cyrtobacter comes]|nr:hypothetical protein [Candidatus Cyrtobacter comes]